MQTAEASSLERIARAVWTPPERVTVDRWADRHRVLVASSSAEAGRWSTDRTPYLRGPMLAFTDPRVRVIVMMTGSQIGKTEFITNCLFYSIDMEPGPTLFVYPNDKLANSTNKDRLVPTIHATAAVARHLTDSPQDVKGLQITFDSMNLWFTGANNATNLKSRPCRIVLEDEIDEFPPGAAATADERTKAFPDSKIIKTSTPSDAGLGVDAEYLKSDQRRYEVPCPHCGKFDELAFERLIWDGGSDATPDQVEKTTRYVCRHCGGEIHDHEKPAMLARGVWAREGESVEDDGTLSGTPVRPDSAVVGFRLSSLYSAFASCSWGHIARVFAENGFVLTREFVTGYLGKAWSLQADKVEAKELDELMVAIEDGGYAAGAAPVRTWDQKAGPLAVLGSIDVQADSVWWALFGIGSQARDWFVLDFGQILTARGGGLREVDWLLGRTVEVGEKQVSALAWAMDTGHRATECYELCVRARNLGKRMVPTKGRETMATPHSISRVAMFPDGRTPIPGGLSLLLINTDYWKESVLGMIKRQGDPEAAAVAGGFYLPDAATWGLAGEFCRQVTSEHKVIVPDRNATKRGLRPTLKAEWRIRPGRKANHALDLLVGALAVAEVGGFRNLGVGKEKPRINADQRGSEQRAEQSHGRETAGSLMRRKERAAGWRERMNRMRERMGARR